MSDWYRVTRRQVIDLGGMGLFYHYSTMRELLPAVYPDYAWQHERFTEKKKRAPEGYWRSARNLLAELGDRKSVV